MTNDINNVKRVLFLDPTWYTVVPLCVGGLYIKVFILRFISFQGEIFAGQCTSCSSIPDAKSEVGDALVNHRWSSPNLFKGCEQLVALAVPHLHPDPDPSVSCQFFIGSPSCPSSTLPLHSPHPRRKTTHLLRLPLSSPAVLKAACVCHTLTMPTIKLHSPNPHRMDRGRTYRQCACDVQHFSTTYTGVFFFFWPLGHERTNRAHLSVVEIAINHLTAMLRVALTWCNKKKKKKGWLSSIPNVAHRISLLSIASN